MASLNSSSSILFMAHSTHRLRKTCPPRTKIASIRQSHASTSPLCRDTRDKDSAYVDRKEYAKGESDDQGSRQTDVTFNPENADLEAQREAAAQESRERSGVCALRTRSLGAIKVNTIPALPGDFPQP